MTPDEYLSSDFDPRDGLVDDPIGATRRDTDPSGLADRFNEGPDPLFGLPRGR
ncbi:MULTISPECIES: hypothetical protein [unclassified Pseudonocardia]|uniref:hypothetical protein n=1 Tax=unclassified Pseudonocardia TaxID=2619320 RepID=UPI0001FFE2C1|nr:hypothetical protein [Pseudonocardia sp. Ae707_Ps1]OLM20859.1 hypothetical protein Ae707Ps1_5118 [Pseudonocardia sp. Ae707_Ps1]